MTPAHTASGAVRLNLAHCEFFSQASPSVDFAPNVAPRVRPRRRAGLGAGLGGFTPSLVDALLNKTAVREVLRWRARNSEEHEEGEELCSLHILDEIGQRARNRDGLLGKLKDKTRNYKL